VLQCNSAAVLRFVLQCDSAAAPRHPRHWTAAPQHINFTIVPDDNGRSERTYANFCAISQTPFDCTLTFCEVQPLSEDEIRKINTSEPGEMVVRAPVRAKVVVPFQVLPNLVAALQEQLRNVGGAAPGGPVH
jgi:hypothetical protein